MKITEYVPGPFTIFRSGVHKTPTKWIGWMEYLVFCFDYNEI